MTVFHLFGCRKYFVYPKFFAAWFYSSYSVIVEFLHFRACFIYNILHYLGYPTIRYLVFSICCICDNVKRSRVYNELLFCDADNMRYFCFLYSWNIFLCPNFLVTVQYFAENLPVFALPDDSLVEVQGEPKGVHKAIELIATHLRKFLVDRSVIGIFELQVSFLFGCTCDNLLWCVSVYCMHSITMLDYLIGYMLIIWRWVYQNNDFMDN